MYVYVGIKYSLYLHIQQPREPSHLTSGGYACKERGGGENGELANREENEKPPCISIQA